MKRNILLIVLLVYSTISTMHSIYINQKLSSVKEKKEKILSNFKVIEVQYQELYDQHQDLIQEYDVVFDETLRLEDEVQLLGSYLANENYEKK